MNPLLAPEHASRSDGDLLQRYLDSRDDVALAELIRRHAPLVRGVCRRILGDSPDADDAFQATFLVLIRCGERIRKPQSLAAWLFGVAHRIARRQRTQRVQPVQSLREEQAMVASDPLTELANRHDVALFDAELARLPEKYRAPIVLHHLEGKSLRDIAAELQLTEGAVDGLLKRGRNELRVRLAKRGVVFGVTLAAIQTSQTAVAASTSETLITATVQSVLSLDPGLHPEFPHTPAAQMARQELTMFSVLHSTKAVFWTLAGTILFGGAALGLTQGSGHQEATLAPSGGISSVLSVAASDQPAPPEVLLAAVVSEEDAETEAHSDSNPPDLDEREESAASESLSNERIYEALQQRTVVSFVDTALRDVLSYFEDLHQVPIVIENDQIKSEINKVVISIDVEGITVGNGLNLILKPHGLGYIIEDGVLKITSRKAAEKFNEDNAKLSDNAAKEQKKKKFVAIGKIVHVEKNGMVYLNVGTADQIRKGMTFEVPAKSDAADKTSTESKGKIEIVELLGEHYSRAMIVREDLFRPMAVGDQVGTSGDVDSEEEKGEQPNEELSEDEKKIAQGEQRPPHFRRLRPAEKHIYDALDQETEVSFVDTALRDALDYIEDLHKFDVIINEKEITDDGASADVQINLELSGVTLESALDLILEPHDLDYIVKDEVLMITTRGKAAEYLELRVYDLNAFAPLIADLDDDESLKRAPQLIKFAVGGVWEEEEGLGGTYAFRRGILAVRQNQRTHREIENLLEQLRRANAED